MEVVNPILEREQQAALHSESQYGWFVGREERAKLMGVPYVPLDKTTGNKPKYKINNHVKGN